MKKLSIILIFGVIASLSCSAQTYQWANKIGSADADYCWSIAVDDSGNVYITGQFQSTADFDPGPATANITSSSFYDIFIAKYDANGIYIWAHGIGNLGNFDIGWDITVDGSQNVYVTGIFSGTVDFDPSAGTANLSSSGSGSSVFFAKYDANGNYVWAKNVGGTSLDDGNSITVDDNENVYITGKFSGTVDFDPGVGIANLVSAGNDDIFFAKYDANGNYIWANNVGGTSNDEGSSIVVDGSGNVYLTGYFVSTVDFDPGVGTANLTSAGFADIFFAKYNANGNYVWANKVGGSSNTDKGYSIALDSIGNVYLTGYFVGTGDFDPGSGTANLTSVGSSDIFFAKYDANGNYVWARSIGSTYSDQGNSIVVDTSGNVYITGHFSGPADFDPGSGTINLIPIGTDIFFAKYDSNGNYMWAENIGGNYVDDGTGIAVDISGNVYIAGSFIYIADFNPSIDTNNLISTAVTYDIFYAKYCQFSGAVTTTTLGVSCFNGNDGSASISVSGGIAPHTFNWSTSDTTGSISGLAAGIYSVTVTNSIACTATDLVTINEPALIQNPTVDTICDNDTIFLQGAYQNTPGTYYDTLTAINGCDSIIATTLTVNLTYIINDPNVSICDGDSVLIYGTYRTTSGTYYDTLTAINGCDSIIATTLTVNLTYIINDPNISICDGDSVLIYGTYRTTSGTYYSNLATVDGCDSIYSTTLILNPTYSTITLDEEICQGDSVLIFGSYYVIAGTYYDSSSTVNGCDSTTSTTLTVSQLPNVVLGSDTTICNSCTITLDAGIGFATYNWSTGENTQSIIVDSAGTYSVQVTDVNGCIKGDTIVVDVSTGIDAFNKTTLINIYPNPNAGNFVIEIELYKSQDLEIIISNNIGQVIFVQNLKQINGTYSEQIDMNSYSKGIYHVQVITNDSSVYRKLIIE